MPRIIDRIRSNLTNPDSQHRQIMVGFLWVSLFVFIGKLAGAFKEMAIAWRYGVSPTVDAYVFVFNLINWPVSIWFSILTVVLIPLAARLRNDIPTELPRFRAELLGLTLLFGFSLGVLAWMGLPLLLQKGWLGLSGQALQEALKITSGLALLAPLGVISALFSAWLLAGGNHRNTLFEAIPALTILIALIMPPVWIPEPLLWGTLAGFALHTASLGIPLLNRRELPPPRFTQRSPAWQFFWGSIGIMALGQALSNITTLIDQFFAANLGSGALSTLSYSNRILTLILGLGATAVGRATLPVFSKDVAQGGANVTTLALHWFKWMLTLGLLVFLVSWSLAPWMVSFLFERGAFTASDTLAVSNVLRYSLLQVVFYFPVLVLASALAAQRRYKIIAWGGAINLICKIPLAFLLVPILGINGIALSTALMYAMNLLFVFYFIKRHPY